MRSNQAKDCLRVPELWKICGLPGKPANSCRSPFREDRTPSFSIYDDGRRWRDHTLGEGGDAIDFLAKAKGIHPAQAYLLFLEMAGKRLPTTETPKERSRQQTVSTLDLKGLELCTDNDLRRLSRLRSIPIQGLQIAVKRRLLFAYEHPFQGRCWVVTDDARRNAICRRLDGNRFHYRDPVDGKKEGPKSRCWKGSKANWPIGIAQAPSTAAIAFCEGGPDFLSAFAAAYACGAEDSVAPVCMTGASCRIHEDALGMFRGRRVRIFSHADEAGQQAVAKWADELRSVEAEVDCFDFSGLVKSDAKPVADLNDFLLADSALSGCAPEILYGAFDFALERQR